MLMKPRAKAEKSGMALRYTPMTKGALSSMARVRTMAIRPKRWVLRRYFSYCACLFSSFIALLPPYASFPRKIAAVMAASMLPAMEKLSIHTAFFFSRR